jgi:hypothetical protein
MLGKLSWAAIPFNEPEAMGASLFIIVGFLVLFALVTWKGWWTYLWREWLTSVDHKRIGVIYVLLALVLLLRGFIDAIMMRSQQAIAAGGAQGYLPPEHYDQIFSAHGTIMIFFVAMPLVVGLMNFVVPLQLGARDVAFPVLNAISLWLTATGALLVNLSAAVGAQVLAGCRRRLLSLGASDLGRGDLARRHQHGHDDLEAARAGHGVHAHACVLLDLARLEHADRRRVSDFDCNLRHAAPRPLRRHAFLHD